MARMNRFNDKRFVCITENGKLLKKILKKQINKNEAYCVYNGKSPFDIVTCRQNVSFRPLNLRVVE